ncbi:MAG TPA: hypothetical protein EYM32_13925 [Dehalococcoidia bacterium]|nr:hypothetical protein [Dehalococcoidia bacterium]
MPQMDDSRATNPLTDNRRVERRLVTILAADVAGYSRLMARGAFVSYARWSRLTGLTRRVDAELPSDFGHRTPLHFHEFYSE